MRITLTGATGFVGTRLVNRLLAAGHEITILSRKARAGSSPRYVVWNPERQDAPAAAFDGCDAVIHLAGEPVAQRWNDAVKRRIRDSRVEGTRKLVRTLSRLPVKPQVLISTSAVGYYGSRGDEALTEESAPGEGFLPEVCVEWEKEAAAAEAFGIRVAAIRVGIVLGRGGALDQMLPAFRLGAGGRLGSGKQWMPWIHLDDLVSLYVFALENKSVRGGLNGSAPHPVTNRDFTAALAKAVSRPAIIPVPVFALKLLFGEMAQVMLASQRVIPEAATLAGFEFKFPRIGPALDQVLR